MGTVSYLADLVLLFVVFHFVCDVLPTPRMQVVAIPGAVRWYVRRPHPPDGTVR